MAIVSMVHSKSKVTVMVLPAQVENMKRNGWVEQKADNLTKVKEEKNNGKN
jgi:hypothetical protein